MSSLPLASERTKAARDFEKDDIVRVQKSKTEWLSNPHGSAYRRYRIIESKGIGRYGYEFTVEDEDGEIRPQGFGSQVQYVVEE